MAESGIVFRYVFDNEEYETYEEAKARAESTVGGGHIYKRMKNISINQIKHWDYMQNPATYEDWEYAIGDDEDMGFVAYVPPYLYFKLEKNTSATTIGNYDHISLYDKERTTKIKDIYLTDTEPFKLSLGEGFTFKFMKGEAEAGTEKTRWLVDKNADVTTFATNKKVFYTQDTVAVDLKQSYFISMDPNGMPPTRDKAYDYGEINNSSFDETYGYLSGSTVILTDSNTVSLS